MSANVAFSVVSAVAIAGWLALAACPLAPRMLLPAGGIAIPLALCALYAVTVAVAPGGFGSLAEVMALFTAPGAVLAGWLHYLAFDLLIGGWQVRDARRRGVPHLAVIPCVFLTLLLGPVGLLAYLGLRAALARKQVLA